MRGVWRGLAPRCGWVLAGALALWCSTWPALAADEPAKPKPAAAAKRPAPAKPGVAAPAATTTTAPAAASPFGASPAANAAGPGAQAAGTSPQAAGTNPQAASTSPAAANASAAPVPAPVGFTVTPVPAWVKPLAVDDPPAALPRAPVQMLLRDRQTRVSDQPTQRYVRSVRQVIDSAGLEGASQVEIEFDPGTQRLQWHTLALWRGGQRVDKLDVRQVKLLHREQQLERQMVDGRLTATVVLDDVRIGDRIELAYTLVGDNPVFGGRFVEIDWTGGSLGPTALYQYRLLSPMARSIRHKVIDEAVTVTVADAADQRETVFRRALAPQFRYDPYAPASVYLKDQVQLSEFADWAEVARWAEQLFANANQGGPTVAERAAAIKAQTADPAERLRLALDLVQTEVRYFGTEIGPYSHQPAAAEKVLVQRFGDCKDKVALLQSLLRALDLPATPVLVSTRYQRDVQALLPSPLAFDHAIARVDLPGKPLWLDGTRSQQTGPVDDRQPLSLGFGLLARADAAALQAAPSASEVLRSSVEDRFTFGSLADAATLETRQTLHGDIAEWVRAARAAMPAADFEQQMLAEVLRAYPGATADGPLQVDEVPGRNALTLVQRLRVAQPWRFPEQRQLVADFAYPSLMAVLRLPDQNPRTQALRLALPGVYRHRVEFRFAEPVFARPSSSKADDNNPFFALALQQEGGTDFMRLSAELRLAHDRVEAADWPRYRDQLMKSWQRLGGTLQVAAITPDRLDGLRAKFDALDDDLKRGRIKVVTAVQRDAHGRLVLLNAQLDSGRLAPKLRAQALIARGERLDHLGRQAEAKADFDQALALDPQNPDAHAARAVNALLRRADADAVAAADQALALSSSQTHSGYIRAYALYFSKDYAAARQALEGLLGSRSEVERSYGPIWLYLAARRGGADHASALSALRGLLPEAQSPAWPYPVLRWLQGSISTDQLLDAARDGGKPDPGRLCELHFFIAEKTLLDGDKRQARRSFERAVDTGVTEFIEHSLARRRMDELDGR